MFKRTFKVVFRSVRNNFVLLPEIYYNIVSTYDTGCLSLQYNGHTHFMSWAPHAGAVKDTEIGINARIAKEIGLNESDLVKCQLVADVMVLRNVFVTPVSAQDWEIIEMSSEKMSETVLQQTRIVNRNQILIIWINKSLQIALTVDRLKPILSYGRMDHTTELIVAPNIFKGYDTNTSNKDTANIEENRLLHSKTAIHCNTYGSGKSEEFLARSHTSVNVKQLPQSQSVAKRNRQEKMERIKKDLLRELTRSSEFRVISGVWHERMQISDIYISKNHQEYANVDLNSLYGMKTLDNNEYYVRLKVSSAKCEMPQTIHPTIEVNVNLMKLLNLKELEKVTLQPRPLIINFVDKIELFAHKKTHYKIIENSFKRFVMEKCSRGSNTVLLNQNEPIRLDEDLIVSVGIVPEHFRYCIIDMQFLKESKIYAADIVRKVDDVISVKASVETPLSVRDLICLPKFDAIVERLVGELKNSLCLDSNNCILRQNNVLLSGSSGSGKTVLIERVLDQLIRKPYYCYFDIFYCTRSKGRKVESIQKDLRSLFTTCLQNAPSVLVLENLDVLAHAVGNQLTQDGEYFNRLADTIYQLIVQYTNTQAIAVIASVTDIQALNKRLYTPRGSHLFQSLIRLPNLEYCDRMKMLSDLCLHIQTKELDLKKIALLTEGYNQLDLVQLVERAIFYAYRLNKIHPVLTNHHLTHSLENTNVYCLHGIESHQGLSKNSSNEDIKVEDIPGLQAELSVLEEVLRWPSKYPKIFNASPLRNQAGVLLYGPPGTGKTMLVSRLADCWNLRMISVKGPELLAKYIGQSEENVRNIFSRARSAQPCVLFFDEFDSLAPKRGHDATGVTDRVVNQLLTELDGVESLQGVTVIAATSRPELLDPALLRSGRIDRLVEFPLPNKTARLGIFKLLSKSLNLDDSVDFEDLATKTENFTGADLQSILTSANMIAVKKALNKVHDKLNQRMNCRSRLTYLLKFVAIWILCGFNTMVTGVPQESACPEEVSESLLIVLENGVSLQRTVPADFKVKIECPFRQPLWWYHNEHPMTINDTLVITALKAKHHSDNYGCKTLENEKDVAIKWANVTLIGCTSFAENVKDDLVLRKWHNMDDALSKRELQLLSKEATVYSTSTIPSISTATINRTALLDENVNLKCHAGDRPLARIVWLKHYAPLNWTEKSVFNFDHNLNVWKLPTSNSEPRLLRLGSVQPEDEGWYSCVATTANQLETVIFSNYLKILNYPVDWDNFNNRSTSEFHREDTDSFEVSVESRVRKIAKKVDDNDQDNVGVIKREDGPQFKNVKKLEDNIHKPSGSSVQLMCPATGNPTPNITWTRNNTEIERTMGRVSYKKWSIQMDDATTEDSGVYKCTICNQHGCIEHSTKVTIRDRLRSPPIISDKFPQNQTVLVNNSTYLECRVVSDLEPSIKWFKYALRRNVTIKELEQTALKTVNKVTNDHNFLLDSVVTLSPDPDRPNILNFTNITHEDEGWYTCVASNTLGHSLASAYMRVVDKLPARDHTPLRGHPVWITAVAVVVVLLFLLGTVFIIYVLRKLKHEKLLKQRIETVHQWTKKVIIYRPPTAEASSNCGDLQMPVIKIEKQRTTFTTSSSSDPMQGFNEYEFPLDSNWEIPRSQLVLGSVLGEGAFGRVVMGEANDLSTSQRPTGTTTIVAVKMVKEEHTDADMTSLVHEMEVMKMIGKHINIINLLGCCSQNGPLWVIVEFAPHGNLKDFLKKNRPLSTWNGRNPECLKKDEECVQLTEKHLISFAFQIARGMEYLASRRCIHRDLAARNVLVSNDFVMKIADFGLARDVQDTDYYRKKTNGRLPIKWMAPESLQDKFYDSQSDVWSYGVLLWEIMTYGEQPYPLIMSAEELYSYLIAGQRMEKPQHCSLNIYMLMRQCWHFDSNARPTFVEIVENLDKILQLANNMLNEEYLDLSIPILETPPSSSDDESLADTLPDKVVVKQKDLLQAFNTTRPTLTAAEIAKYQRTYAKFTNKDRSFREPVTKRTTLA